MDIVEFLEARIAEDEGAAEAATEGPWEWRPKGDTPGIYPVDGRLGWVALPQMTQQQYLALTSSDPGAPKHSNAEHIARHNPARILAECKAKRAIIDAIRRQEEDDDPMAWIVASGILLKTMAAVYADHEDYAHIWAQ